MMAREPYAQEYAQWNSKHSTPGSERNGALEGATIGIAVNRHARLIPMSVDEFDKFFRDEIAATVKLAKDINLVPMN